MERVAIDLYPTLTLRSPAKERLISFIFECVKENIQWIRKELQVTQIVRCSIIKELHPSGDRQLHYTVVVFTQWGHNYLPCGMLHIDAEGGITGAWRNLTQRVERDYLEILESWRSEQMARRYREEAAGQQRNRRRREEADEQRRRVRRRQEAPSSGWDVVDEYVDPYNWSGL